MVKMKRNVPDVSVTVQGPPTRTNGHYAVNDGPQVAHAALAQPTRDTAVRRRAYDLYANAVASMVSTSMTGIRRKGNCRRRSQAFDPAAPTR